MAIDMHDKAGPPARSDDSTDSPGPAARGPTILDPAPREVLVMRALPGLGDLLCVTPALRALRAALPRARISLLGLPGTRGLLARYAHLVDDFIAFPGFPGLTDASAEPGSVTAFPGFLRAVQGRFDLALQMHGDGTISNTLVRLLGARRAAGWSPRGLPCPDPTSFTPYREDLPEPLRWLALLDFLGVPAQGQQLEFPLGPGDAAELGALMDGHDGLDEHARLAVLHVGAAERPRRLEPALLARIADGLALRGLRVILTGTADERPIAAAVVAQARREPLDWTGRSSIGALGALVSRAQLLVASDTGVSYLASALRTPSVVVFLAGDVQRWAPLDRTRHRAVDFNAAPPGVDRILAEVDAALATAANVRTHAPAALPLDVRDARRVLLVAPPGGTATLGPALRRLRAALPAATLVLLAAGEELDASNHDGTFADLVDERMLVTGALDFNLEGLPALIARLTAARLDAALIFTAEGETAFEAAYIAYLAGVPLRAGLAAELGGGVLSSPVLPPPDGVAAAERHLFLLHRLGL